MEPKDRLLKKAQINWLHGLQQPWGCDYHRHAAQGRHRKGCAKAMELEEFSSDCIHI